MVYCSICILPSLAPAEPAVEYEPAEELSGAARVAAEVAAFALGANAPKTPQTPQTPPHYPL